MSFLTIENACFSYGEEPVVDRIDWRIEQGEFHCLVGRSGCGKTTLLKIAAGLLPPSEGSIRVQGTEIREPSALVGFVFQTPNLLEWLTVLDNILLPPSLHRTIAPSDRDRAQDLLALVGLGGLDGRYPNELSGGQQSRVAIARGLITDPLILLMDEPFAALDAMTREDLQDDLLALCATKKTTALFVTHDIAEAVYLADRVAVMEAGRIRDALAVALPRPRAADIRYSPEFSALCREARLAMDGLAA